MGTNPTNKYAWQLTPADYGIPLPFICYLDSFKRGESRFWNGRSDIADDLQNAMQIDRLATAYPA
jgi:hypothetical protein